MRAYQRQKMANLVYSYLKEQNYSPIQLKARDVVNFHQLPNGYSKSISSFLNHIYNNSKVKDFGFYILEKQGSKGGREPYRFSVILL